MNTYIEVYDGFFSVILRCERSEPRRITATVRE
jgi:hypothetical protein